MRLWQVDLDVSLKYSSQMKGHYIEVLDKKTGNISLRGGIRKCESFIIRNRKWDTHVMRVVSPRRLALMRKAHPTSQL